MNSRYPAIHTTSSAAIRASIVAISRTDPTTDDSENAAVSIRPDTTSVAARAVCICFCAIRPAKSLSKNVTACPMVYRWMRDRISGNRFGSNRIEAAAVFRPNTTGRAIR